MIGKTREYPREIMILEAIVRRFPSDDFRKTEFERKLYRKRAGYKGEKVLDYFLEQIDHTEMVILNDLRIQFNSTHFQIDTLIITPYFLLIIDSKNYAGTLIFLPEFNQLIRIQNDIEEVFPDPILQTKNQAYQLKAFLNKHHFTPPPIEFLVAISNTQAIIKNPTNDKEVSYRVFRSSNVAFKLPPFYQKHTQSLLTKNDMKKIARQLVKAHEPLVPDPKTMNLPFEKMVKGVQCPACETFGMDYHQGKWTCKNCGHKTGDAHIQALRDYFLIYGPSINSKQFRDFTNVKSSSTAKRLLTNMDLNFLGTTKGRTYSPRKSFFD
ncbi:MULTISPECIES: nuclease-related domain-containing protein [unclassified Mesobacillus]|uniref:nuclease-related domain-containing protein n=1 Tax=unclassified Mesobacillus TaxID=2675270 RepID=UPI00203EDBC8|nr:MULTISPECIES: nuclease-related domain-containing protein [unclassified Mesobacillus]MCM3124049.1 NERD domain-containing protein [Mesobacillus sp. MER 33]MCM3233898.1 NERD domain-containing protein [Mesobacillus sp. MER 48]